MSSVHPDANARATDSFTETLEKKWAKEREQEKQGKTEQVTSAQPQDGENSFGDAELLEPVTATKGGMCDGCRSYIERGEAIVHIGDRWVHAVCAANAGLSVSGVNDER